MNTFAMACATAERIAKRHTPHGWTLWRLPAAAVNDRTGPALALAEGSPR